MTPKRLVTLLAVLSAGTATALAHEPEAEQEARSTEAGAWVGAPRPSGLRDAPSAIGPSLTLSVLQPDPDAAGSEAEQGEVDKSGTDPTKFLRTLRLVNEYAATPNDDYLNILSFQYVQPFAEQTMNLRLKLPLVSTDAAGDGAEIGLGDISLRYNWLASVSTANALLLGAEVVGDTATEDALGRGKWTVGPLATYAIFLNKNVIFAPTYQHNVSFAGDGDRRDVNESILDFYLVMTSDDKRSWVTVDPTLAIDWERDGNTPFTVETELGRRIGTLWGGALNAYIRPGVGIGQDRPYDWNVEVGFTLIGF